MATSIKPYGIVGGGRLAKSFVAYFRFRNIPFLQWTRDSLIPPAMALRGCGTVLILIKDDQIESFIVDHLDSKEFDHFVHCSGSLITPFAHSWHPLTAFPADGMAPADFEKVPFIGVQGSPAFSDVMPTLPHKSYVMSAADRPLYHASCVMAGNFATILWQRFYRDLERMGLDADLGEIYLKSILKNFLEAPESALTGPLVRQDFSTIIANLRAIKNDARFAIYQAFLKLFSIGKIDENTRLSGSQEIKA
jgi:hypothetical protein